MSPQSASRGPVERVYVERIHCPDTEQLAASVGGLGRENSDFFVSSLEFQVGSRLYVTTAVKAASHFGRAQGDHSGQSTFEVRWNLSHSQVHTQRLHTRQVP